MPANTIDDVIQSLNIIIDSEKAKNSTLGFFPALYRQVTMKVKQGIADGFFDDGPRMERFDVIFANRYLDAFDTYQSGNKPTRAWRVAFNAAPQDELIILQHLLLGINAHINLDLGIAAAEVAPGDALPDLEGDFNKINDILVSLLDPAQDAINEFSPLMELLDKVGGNTDEAIANFSIDKARQEAWENAQLLASQSSEQQSSTINLLDRKVSFLGRLIVNPGYILGKAIEIIRFAESRDVPAIIDALGSIQ